MTRSGRTTKRGSPSGYKAAGIDFPTAPRVPRSPAPIHRRILLLTSRPLAGRDASMFGQRSRTHQKARPQLPRKWRAECAQPGNPHTFALPQGAVRDRWQKDFPVPAKRLPAYCGVAEKESVENYKGDCFALFDASWEVANAARAVD